VTALGPSLLRVVRRVLGSGNADEDDVTQDAMFAVLRALPEFRAECSVLHFACRIAVLTAMNARRRHVVRRRFTEPAGPDEASTAVSLLPSPAARVEQNELRDQLRELLAELPLPQAEALAMHCVLGYSIAETAAVCGAPLNTVRSRLLAAKTALRKRVLEAGTLESVGGAL
jgi:RNA polymerase sigma-70 factor (ECF subfamily)